MNRYGTNRLKDGPRSINMEDPSSIKAFTDYLDKTKMSASAYVRKKIGVEERTYSNGENGFKYFTDAIFSRDALLYISPTTAEKTAVLSPTPSTSEVAEGDALRSASREPNLSRSR